MATGTREAAEAHAPGAGRGEPGAPAERRHIFGAALAHGLTLAAAGAFLLWLGRDQWFQSDAFDFIANRGVLGDPELGLFAPHNEHWSTIPILVWRALHSVFALRSYTPYLAVLIGTHLVVVHLVWRAARRSGAGDWAATALAAVLAVPGVGWENLLWAFQAAWMGSLAFGFAAVLFAVRGDRDLAAVLAGITALACSSIGVVLVGAAGLAAGLARDVRAAFRVALPPALVFVVWAATAGRVGLARAGGADLAAVPAYTVRGIVDALDALVGAPLGIVLVAAVVVWAVVAVRRGAHEAAVGVALLAGALVFLFLAGLGRAGLGLAELSPRYAQVVAVLSGPALAATATAALGRVPAGRTRLVATGALAVLTVGVLVQGIPVLLEQARVYGDAEQAWRQRIVAAAAVIGAPEAVSEEVTQDLDVTELARLRDEGGLPDVDPGLERVREARALLRIGPTSAAPRGTASLVASARVALDREGSCLRATPTGDAPQIVLEAADGAVLTVLAAQDGAIDVETTVDDRPVRRPRPLLVDGGAPVRVALADSTTAVLTLSSPTQLCALRS